jgi:predicted secreted protein
MTSGLAGYGTLFKIGDGGTSEVFTTVAEVTNIGGPKFALDTLDVTNHSSTSAWREFIAGLLDPGELSLDLSFVPTGATHSQTSGLLRDMKNRTKRNFQMVFPDVGGTTWAFSGYVTGFEVGAPVDDKLSASVTIKITGAPTLAG